MSFPLNKFIAKMGAEALHELLRKEDLDANSYKLRHQANNETSQQRKNEALKRLQVIESFREANTRIVNRPEWMIVKVVCEISLWLVSRCSYDDENAGMWKRKPLKKKEEAHR